MIRLFWGCQCTHFTSAPCPAINAKLLWTNVHIAAATATATATATTTTTSTTITYF
jgi:hypothetical protein